MKKNCDIVDKGANRYVIGDVKPFDQKNDVFKRLLWDEKLLDVGQKFYTDPIHPKSKDGYQLKDMALVNASWHLEDYHGWGCRGGQWGLYRWDWEEGYSYPNVPSTYKIDIQNPREVTNSVKVAGLHLGAAKVGVCELDRRWIYSDGYTRTKGGSGGRVNINIPENYRYAVVMALEMDYEAISYSPQGPGAAAAGLGYSKMAFVAGSMASFIRGLGYKAIPNGNDTACSIPMAIDAGLGELGRHGLLINPDLGPRLRLAKVFTDLPLVPDKPIAFGVWEFCKTCKKCAENCPSQAISDGEPFETPLSISNREGLRIWYVDAEKCIRFWTNNSLDCANCIRTCPFNKSSGFIHDTARWLIRKSPLLNKSIAWLDDLFGYGKAKNSAKYWSNIR